MTRTPRTLTSEPGLTRRCALLGAGGLGAAAVLAACSSGSSGTAAPVDASSPSGASGSSGSSGASGSSAPGSGASPSASGSASSSAAAGGATIAALSDVPVGGTAEVTANGDQVLLSQPTAGTVEAFSPVCPHQGGQVKPDGGKFRCSLHFSEFDLDGAVTKGPARSDLKSIAVTVSGDQIVAG